MKPDEPPQGIRLLPVLFSAQALKNGPLNRRRLLRILQSLGHTLRRRGKVLFLQLPPFVQGRSVNHADDQPEKVSLFVEPLPIPFLPGILNEFLR